MAFVSDETGSPPDRFAVAPSAPPGPDRWVIAPTPVAVWTPGSLQPCLRRGHHREFGQPPCAWRWPRRLWEQLLAAYSCAGDRVLVTDGGNGAVVRVAARMQRRITVRIPSRFQRAGVYLDLLEEQPRRVRRQILLFGDQPSSDVEAARQWPAKALRHLVDLLVIPPPCPADEPSARAASTPESEAGEKDHDGVLALQLEMLVERAGLVRPGGVVVVLTRVTPSRDGAVDRIGRVVAQARGLGLRYLQHVPVVHADLRDGRFQPAYGPDDPTWHLNLDDDLDWREWMRLSLRHPASSDGVGPTSQPRLHMPIHSDLLVFDRPDREPQPSTPAQPAPPTSTCPEAPRD